MPFIIKANYSGKVDLHTRCNTPLIWAVQLSYRFVCGVNITANCILNCPHAQTQQWQRNPVRLYRLSPDVSARAEGNLSYLLSFYQNNTLYNKYSVNNSAGPSQSLFTYNLLWPILWAVVKSRAQHPNKQHFWKSTLHKGSQQLVVLAERKNFASVFTTSQVNCR